jgi:hypothetical protein
MYRCISAYSFIIVLYMLLPCIIILFLDLLSTTISVLNLAIFPLLLKPVALEERMG